jgi:hypothetical protein
MHEKFGQVFTRHPRPRLRRRPPLARILPVGRPPPTASPVLRDRLPSRPIRGTAQPTIRSHTRNEYGNHTRNHTRSQSRIGNNSRSRFHLGITLKAESRKQKAEMTGF